MPSRNSIRIAVALATLLLLPAPSRAQSAAPAPAATPVPWYQTFRIRGYGQVRYNRLFETNPQLQCEQCDRNWGEQTGFSIRRARLIVQGQIHPQVSIYLQPDFASAVGGSQYVGQMRDWYVDVGVDRHNEFRFRFGQSKIPYSYESMQSSGNRLPLDRADGTNSAHVNERDMGVFFMWADSTARARLAELATSTGKGSGDYGVLAIGMYNGQGANRPEANNNQHVVARLSYPFKLFGTYVEPGVAAYTGQVTLASDQRTAGVKGRADWTYVDERILTSINIAPRPFGLLAEYNVGRGPEYNPARDSIETQSLHGGFVTATYQIHHGSKVAFPFLRYQVYEGGKKHERDARSHSVNDVEVGVEWQFNPNFELVTEWYHGDRRFEDKQRPRNRQVGSLFRIQAQFNY